MDTIAALNRRILDGELSLTFDPRHGYLPSLLAALDIPVESQTLVYSKTSRQRDLISERAPRALYFSDTVAVGVVPGGDAIEIITFDPARGLAFSTLAQRPGARPQLAPGEQCFQCHIQSDSGGVPSLLMRSLRPPDDRAPALPQGRPVDHRTPFADRWGGWYVTGSGVPRGHLGNLTASNEPAVRSVRTMESVLDGFDASAYLSPYSDIVALMVLGHQVEMTNLLIRLAVEMQRPAQDTGSSPGRGLSPTVRALARDVAAYMLFLDEARLPGPVRGSSGFAAVFSAKGRRDEKGRSLRDLDLNDRLFRYPCSFMIDSRAFDDLPAIAKAAVYEELWEILSGRDPRSSRLPLADRSAIVDVLAATKPGVPAYFKRKDVS